ncbi:MAG: FAD-dependent thymidylate synthase, partial [Chloroflexi bacterium]|nr:FAD-dependent thymidylate synthase [Chloroflexota bacterium]
QEVSQIAARAIEDNRVGLAYLEKSSRYVPFDDRVNGQFRYYRPAKIIESAHGRDYIATMDMLFETYARALPRMSDHLARKHPIEAMEFENALTGDVQRFPQIRDDEMRQSAQWAYRQAVRARACDMLRCFLPLATLTNVGVWGNGRALEYLLIKLYANPLDEIQTLAQAAQYELSEVIGPFIKRAHDDKGAAHQAFLQATRARQRELSAQYLTQGNRASGDKATLVRFDPDAVDQVVAAILYPASDRPKADVLARVRALGDEEKVRIVRAYCGERRNRRHKPGRAFERAVYEFDLLLNIGEFRDLQRHRMVSAERQAFTTALGWETNDDVREVAEIHADYRQAMEQAARLYERLAEAMPLEAQYVVPFGYRVRYNVQLNLREAYHWIELRSTPQGHPDYRRTSHAMYRAIQAVHPLLVEAMTFVDLTPDVPIGRLRAEMRRARRRASTT